MSDRRQAFTLFEVMISLVVITIVVLAAVLVIPVGLRAQQNARTSMYASIVAMSLMESFHNPIGTWNSLGQDLYKRDSSRIAQYLRNQTLHSAPMQPDFERMTSRVFCGAIPLPLPIANRLESEDGEIARLLENGGRLYYPDPGFVRNLQLGATRSGSIMSAEQPPEFHKLVFAVVGHAQQNALDFQPQESWPIYEIYPFPPSWLSYSMKQLRSGPVSIAPDPVTGKYHKGTTLTSAYAEQRFGDGGLISSSWGGDTSPSLVEALDESHANNPKARYHGRHWLRFQTALPGSTWTTGWTAFQALAGDINAGWLPVLGTYDISSDYQNTPTDPDHTMYPGKTRVLPTYEMRASYRDRAIRLWNAIRGTLPAIGSPPADPVTDSRSAVYRYEVPPDELNAWTPTDPYTLTGTAAFPPHPAQVMALSYLAHAAMAVCGQFPPWESEVFNHDRSASVKNTFSPFWKDPSGSWKDTLLVSGGAGSGGVSVACTTAAAAVTARYHAKDYVWFEDSPEYVYRLGSTVTGVGSVTLSLDKRYKLLRNGEFLNEDAVDTGALHNALSAGSKAIRVASDTDRAFARKVHEMCLRWAMAYASENPYDWGAPRPANRQLCTDRPLVMFDPWHDAAPATYSDADNGTAIRTMAGRYTENESFYRWIVPRNPWAPAWSQGTGNTNANAITHLGPFDSTISDWTTFQNELASGRFRPPPSSSPGFANADQQRFWLNRPFSPVDRTRRLVFWSVDWKNYEDAETTMSAVMDLAAYGMGITETGALTPAGDLSIAGNPEGLYVWDAATRNKRWCDSNTGDGKWYVTKATDRDLMMGHWGADRNNNGRLDIGSIPRSTRLRAVKVADFNLYDPVLRLRVRN